MTAATQFESEINAFEAADLISPPPRGGIVFIGSSSVRFWKTLAEDFPQHPVINRGFGGSHLAHAVHFADRIVIPYAPRQVVVYAGTNDIGEGVTPEKVAQDFGDFTAKIWAAWPETRIAYISNAPQPGRAALVNHMQRANELIAAQCGTDPRLDFIPVFPAMLTPEGKSRPELWLEDQHHMTAAGYAIWAGIVGTYLGKGDCK